MPTFSRRRFVLASAATAALPGIRSFAESTPTLTLHPDRPGPTIPANFVGLSYEAQQLTDPTFFSAENTGLIAQFRALAPHGVLRIGGNTSDVGWWKPTSSSPRPPINVRNTGTGEPNADLAYPITPQSTVNLRAFLDATGWTCLYGINLGTNTPERAADQAAQVARVLGLLSEGGKLQYFQLGNEPDLFRTHLRDPKTWSADLYFDEWLAEANAIRARVPHARFGLPDTAGNPEWYATVVTRLLATPQPPDVAALTHHYYFGGPPSNPRVNIDRLLQPDPRVLQLAHDIHDAAARLSAGARSSSGGEHRTVPYRMTEGNTCFRGGKPGVSDVFAASLWAADYMLLLASLGYAGVNLHGGTAKFVANSLGGKLPGDDLLKDPNAPHPRPFYTPIADIDGSYVAEPVCQGMKFAQYFAGATLIGLDFNPGPVDATAYAATLPSGQKIVAVINKDATRPLHIDLPGYSLGKILSAPSLTSTDVQLGEPRGNREASTVAPATAVILYASR
jgi:hypothetical protein